MNKQAAIYSIKDMPQDFELDELIERLLVLDKIEKGRKDIQKGNTFSHGEARGKLDKWLK